MRKKAFTNVIHYDNVIRILEVMQLMRHQHSGGVPQIPVDTLVEQLPAYVSVHC